jgi:alpha-galactosidase
MGERMGSDASAAHDADRLSIPTKGSSRRSGGWPPKVAGRPRRSMTRVIGSFWRADTMITPSTKPHLGAACSHTGWPTSALAFRLATALFGSAGIEWNLNEASESELELIAARIAHDKRLRPLLHSGAVVRMDSADPALHAHGVIAQDRSSDRRAGGAHRTADGDPRAAARARPRSRASLPNPRARPQRARPVDPGRAATVADRGLGRTHRSRTGRGRVAMPLHAPEQAQLVTLDAE